MGQGHIDTQVYQEVIGELRAYTSRVSESTAQMRVAANNCVDTMEGDAATAKSYTALSKSLDEIHQGVQMIYAVILGMQQELEDALQAQAQAEFD